MHLEPGLEGDAIVALHGSWATRPNGQASGDPASRREPKLMRVHFEDGEARGVEDLVTFFQAKDGSRWARPWEWRSDRTAPFTLPAISAPTPYSGSGATRIDVYNSHKDIGVFLGPDAQGLSTLPFGSTTSTDTSRSAQRASQEIHKMPVPLTAAAASAIGHRPSAIGHRPSAPCSRKRAWIC